MKELSLIGVPVNAVNVQELLDLIDKFVADSALPKLIGYVNLHGLYVASDNQDMMNFYNTSSINYIDGMPIVLMAKLFHKNISITNRITFLDFYSVFFKQCVNNNYKVMWIGAQESVLLKGLNEISRCHEGLNISGIDGYRALSYYNQRINEVKPDILILGLGMPMQEKLALELEKIAQVKIIWCVGATIEYIAGNVPTPPRWLGPIGMEWIFRLYSNPKHLAYRYMVEPFLLLRKILAFKIRKIW